MHIRCKQCHGSVQILLEADPKGRTGTSCTGCGQQYELKLSGSKAERLLADARRIALEHQIDLPGAYSVLVGVMDLDQVRALQDPARSVAPAPAADAGGGRKLRYDPAFHEAVEAGFLTPQQAFERGKREALAVSLSAKHHLPLERARAVADNRIALLSAIRERKAGPSAPVDLVVPARSSRALASGMLAVALLGVLAALLFSVFVAKPNSGSTARRPKGEVRIQTNTEGLIVRIEGPDPASVLDAYCESGESQRELECLRLMPSARNEPGIKLGIIRDRSAPEHQLAIYISKDRSGRRWTAGNGRSPLVAFQAPDDPAQSHETGDSR